MKTQNLVVLASVLVACCVSARSASAFDLRQRRLGLGFELGDPSGLSMKYYWKERWTVQAGLGFFGWPSGGGVHLDLLHEWPDAIDTSTRDFKLPLFLGMGLKSGEFAYCRNAGIGNDCFSRGVAALRLPMGMAIQLDHEPIELAAEFAPSIYTHFDNVGWEGDLALHVRYFY